MRYIHHHWKYFLQFLVGCICLSSLNGCQNFLQKDSITLDFPYIVEEDSSWQHGSSHTQDTELLSPSFITQEDIKQEYSPEQEASGDFPTFVTEPPQPPLQTTSFTSSSYISQKDICNKIAVLLPLSGTGANTGHMFLNSIKMALFDTSNKETQLLIYDTETSGETTLNLIKKIKKKGIRHIIGPIFTSEIEAIRQYSIDHNLCIIAFSNNTALASPNLLLLSFSPFSHVQGFKEFIQSFNEKRILALLSPTKTGETFAHILGKEMTETSIHYIQHINDLSASELYKHIEAYSPDILYIPEGGEQTQKILAYLKFYGLNLETTSIYGSEQWLIQGNNLKDPSFHNTLLVAALPEWQEKFSQRYKKYFLKTPNKIASLAYDAAALMLALLETSKEPLLDIKQQKFRGINGTFSFTEQGISIHERYLLKVTPKELKILSSPKSTHHSGDRE